MHWVSKEGYIEIYPPMDFNFKECLLFLNRSSQEVLHRIKEGHLYKLLKFDESLILCKISWLDPIIRVEFPLHIVSKTEQEWVVTYIWEWFDLDYELDSFYRGASEEKLLKELIIKYRGLRIIGIPDLFEAICWAILGQQITLSFAYRLKKSFVEHYGECISFEEEDYWTFPSAHVIAELNVEELKKLQFSTRKAEYIIDIAKVISNGQLSKEDLLALNDYHLVKKRLVSQRGVGPWTADYVMMKCLHFSNAFPIGDVGLHNAIKVQARMNRKPTLEELTSISKKWKGFEAYAIFYLWRSLYETS